MAELGIIASVVQIADTGLRLSIKLYTFGEIVSTADKSVISISKDVSLTSSVLKELGSLLENDAESHIFSKNAVQTADTVVKECLEVFQEMESILVKKLPSLSGQDGIRGCGGGKKSKATALLERMKWGYLQPKLQLLRSNLDRLKSTLLLMLNVITYARQVAGKSEPPSVIEDQRSLIEDLARSNQDYIRKFEQMKLGIQGTPKTQEEDVQRDRTGRGIELQREQDTQNYGHSKSKSKSESMNPERTTTANVNINNMFINANVRSMSIPPGIEKTTQSRKTQELGSEKNSLFSHLKHYLSLVNNLLDEVDEIKYEIRIDSRDRVRTDICQAYQREMKQLVTSHKNTKFVLAEQQLAPLVAGVKRRLEQIDGPDPGGQCTKKMFTGVVNGGPEQIPQTQPDPHAMQSDLERAENSFSMSYNNDLSHPDLHENFDFESFLQSTNGGNSTLVEPFPGRSFKAPENIVHATDAINNVDQHHEEMEKPIAVREQDSGPIITPSLQHGILEASQQRFNRDQQLQRIHSLPIQHQQGQTHLNKATPNATAAAGSEPPEQQGPNDPSSALAHYLTQYEVSNHVLPRQSTSHQMISAVQEPLQAHPNFPTHIPLPKSGVSQQMARPNTQQQQVQQHHIAQQQQQQQQMIQQQAQQHHIAQPQQMFRQLQAQQHHIAQQQQMIPNTQQLQAQQYHPAQYFTASQQQQLQRLQQVQQAQQRQQHANVSGNDQIYQARGNGQAEQLQSQVQSIQGEPQPSLSRCQVAAQFSPTIENPQKKRGRPSKKEAERRIHGASAPIATFGSRPQARPLLGPLHSPADESGNLSGSQAQSIYDHASPGTPLLRSIPLPKSIANSSNPPREPFEEKERNINALSGHEINEDGEVRSEEGDSIGRVTDGHLPILVGLEVDDNGYVVDNEGNKVGDCALMQSFKEDERPTEEETIAAHNRDIAKDIKSNKFKPRHAMRRPRGPGGNFLASKKESLNEEGERKEAQVPQSVADSRPQMSSLEGLEPPVTQLPRYITTLPEAPLQQPQHLAPLGSFLNSNQVFPPNNAMFQYNNATNDCSKDIDLTKLGGAANTAGSPISASERSSKASLKRDSLALNGTTVVQRARKKLAARRNRSGAFEKRPDGESEKPEDNEKGVSDASHSAHDGKDSTKFHPPSLKSLTEETPRLPQEEKSDSNDKGQAADLGAPETDGDFALPRRSINEKRCQKHPATLQCTLCQKKFTRAYNLRSHMRTHNDERPFLCSVCGKGFAHQHDRMQHEKSHSETSVQQDSANELRAEGSPPTNSRLGRDDPPDGGRYRSPPPPRRGSPPRSSGNGPGLRDRDLRTYRPRSYSRLRTRSRSSSSRSRSRSPPRRAQGYRRRGIPPPPRGGRQRRSPSYSRFSSYSARSRSRSPGASRWDCPDSLAVKAVGLSSLEPLIELSKAPELIRAPPIVREVVTHNGHIDHGFERTLKRSWQAQTPPLSSPLGLKGDGMEGELLRDEGSDLAMDDINLDLDLDLDLGLDFSPATPDPSKPREGEEEDHFCKSSVPMAGKAGNVVDELVTLWTLLPVG